MSCSCPNARQPLWWWVLKCWYPLRKLNSNSKYFFRWGKKQKANRSLSLFLLKTGHLGKDFSLRWVTGPWLAYVPVALWPCGAEPWAGGHGNSSTRLYPRGTKPERFWFLVVPVRPSFHIKPTLWKLTGFEIPLFPGWISLRGKVQDTCSNQSSTLLFSWGRVHTSRQESIPASVFLRRRKGWAWTQWTRQRGQGMGCSTEQHWSEVGVWHFCLVVVQSEFEVSI